MSTPLEQWVEQAARMTRPERILWCDGSDAQQHEFFDTMLGEGRTVALNPQTYPNCFLHRSDPSDVARTEQVTFICSRNKEDAPGQPNNWMAPADAKARIGKLFEGAMAGRTMYVIPYIMGPADSPISRFGVEVTDSAYVAANMRIMTRMGRVAKEKLGSSDDFVPGLHSLGDLNPERRFIAHFPEEKLIWSIGSGYGGNALLGKKCFALRIASYLAQKQGWMAEHMLILGLEDPSGKVTYMGAAFPSACGKTNLAMMVSALENIGYRVWTVGDDIAWMHIGADGYLHAINPEAGYFGVAPGTGTKTNPNVMVALRQNTIFTNVAMTPSLEPWWEGIESAPRRDWWIGRGEIGTRRAGQPLSLIQDIRCRHSNRQAFRPTGRIRRAFPSPCLYLAGDARGLLPLVYEAFDWRHGVLVGAGMGSETTAAATGKVGVTRRDPMAMLPFCGYNMGDYFQHWLDIGKRIPHPPRVFHVNWFRKGADGKFLWPGFGENVRVLKWILERTEGKAAAQETPIGFVPTPNSLTLDGLKVSRQAINELLEVNASDWAAEQEGIGAFLAKFGDHLPPELREEQARLARRLGAVNAFSR